MQDNIYNIPLKYNSICEIMEDEQKSGKGRELQLNKWRQYYDIDKIGTLYYIKRKYDENEIKLIANHGKFTTYITDILIDYLSKIEDHKISLTYYEIFEITSMVNKNYNKGRNNIQNTFSISDEIEKFNINLSKYAINEGKSKYQEIRISLNDFFLTSNKLLKEIVKNSLKSMKQQSLIMYSDSFRLYRKPIGDIISAPHDCNEMEVSMILDYQREGLELIGLDRLNQLIYVSKDKYDIYRNYVISKIQDNLGYDSYTNSINIILAQDGLKREALKFNNKKQLNNNVTDKMLTSKEMALVIKELNKQFVKEYIELQ